MLHQYLQTIDKTQQKQYETDPLTIGSQVIFVQYDAQNIPDKDFEIALIGVCETRWSTQTDYQIVNHNEIRQQLYRLALGNWHLRIADLGDIKKGNTPADTHYALEYLVKELTKQQKIILILGGDQSLTISQYKGLAHHLPIINISSIDAKIDLSLEEENLNASNFINKLIADEPYKLFNFHQLAYQSYYTPQVVLDLIEKLNFDYLRLGNITQDMTEAEPYLRDSHLVSIDMQAIACSTAPAHQLASPNGLNGREICALMRYAGMSHLIQTVGIYEYNPLYDNNQNQSAQLIAQMIWYFIEGLHLRTEIPDFTIKEQFQRYFVTIAEKDYIFFKNIETQKWWMELSFNKTLYYIPVSESDYLKAVDGEIPDRWWKNFKKNLT